MRNKSLQQTVTTDSSMPFASSAGNALPPTNFVDTLLASLFPESESNNDILAPFDYEGFLRREGLS